MPACRRRRYRRTAARLPRCCGTGLRHRHRTRPPGLARAGPEVHRHGRGEPADKRRRGHRDQPHRLPRLHLRRPARLQAGPRRKVRFMAKKEVFDHKVTGPIMRSLRHIPVDRHSGAASFDAPSGSSRKASWSASIPRPPSAAASRSRSSSRARPAWRSTPACRSSRTSSGAHSGSGPRATRRTCGGPRCRSRWPVGEPIPPTLPATELTALLHSRMQHLLDQVQDDYDRDADRLLRAVGDLDFLDRRRRKRVDTDPASFEGDP